MIKKGKVIRDEGKASEGLGDVKRARMMMRARALRDAEESVVAF